MIRSSQAIHLSIEQRIKKGQSREKKWNGLRKRRGVGQGNEWGWTSAHSECLGFPGLLTRVSVETSPPSCMTPWWYRAGGSLSEFTDLLNFLKQLLLGGLEAAWGMKHTIRSRQWVHAPVSTQTGTHNAEPPHRWEWGGNCWMAWDVGPSGAWAWRGITPSQIHIVLLFPPVRWTLGHQRWELVACMHEVVLGHLRERETDRETRRDWLF